jgi:hypothetical protein
VNTTELLWLYLSFALVFVAGIGIGVGEVAPWLHRRHLRKLLRPMQVAKVREVPPVTTIVPYMVALDGGAAEWRRLEIPAVTRRRTEKN